MYISVILGLLMATAGGDGGDGGKYAECHGDYAACWKIVKEIKKYPQDHPPCPDGSPMKGALNECPNPNLNPKYKNCHKIDDKYATYLSCRMSDGSIMYTNVRKELTAKEKKTDRAREIKQADARRKRIDVLFKRAKTGRAKLELERLQLRYVCENALPQHINAGIDHVEDLNTKYRQLIIKVYKLPAEFTKIAKLKAHIERDNKQIEDFRGMLYVSCPKAAQELGIQLR